MPILFVLIAASLWGLVGPVSRFAFAEGLGGAEVAFWRAGIGALCFGLQAILIGKTRVAWKDLPGLALFGLVGVTGLEGANLVSVEQGGASLASILLYSAPAWVAFFSWVFFKESMTRIKFVALFLSVSGVTGVAWAGGSDSLHFSLSAVVWGLVSGLSYALFYIFGKYYFRRYAVPTVFLYVFPFGTLGLLPFAEFHAKSGKAWAALIFLGVASTFVSYFLYSLGLKRMQATRAAIIASFEPVMAAITAFWIWSERLSVAGYVWGGVVLLGVALMAVSGEEVSSS